MWITGTPAARAAAASPLTFSTTLWLFACAGAPEVGERAALHDDVVLHVLDDQRGARSVEIHRLLLSGGREAARRPPSS
jgi:hypothetical protein